MFMFVSFVLNHCPAHSHVTSFLKADHIPFRLLLFGSSRRKFTVKIRALGCSYLRYRIKQISLIITWDCVHPSLPMIMIAFNRVRLASRCVLIMQCISPIPWDLQHCLLGVNYFWATLYNVIMFNYYQMP